MNTETCPFKFYPDGYEEQEKAAIKEIRAAHPELAGCEIIPLPGRDYKPKGYLWRLPGSRSWMEES